MQFAAPAAALRALEPAVAARSAARPTAIDNIHRTALWAGRFTETDRQIGVVRDPRPELQIELLEQQDVLAVVFDHLAPRLLVAVDAAFPEVKVGLDFLVGEEIETQ